MSRLASIAALTLALALGGPVACSSVSVNQDYDPTADFASLRTFDWFPGGRQLSGNVELDSPLIAERIRAAVTRELTLTGYQKVADRTPDFFVNYQLSSQQKLSTSGVTTGVGIGSYGSWGGVGVGMGSSPVRSYEEGTLVIDVIDAASRKLVWRGTGSKALSGGASPEETTRAVDEAVGRILAQFPPQQ